MGEKMRKKRVALKGKQKPKLAEEGEEEEEEEGDE